MAAITAQAKLERRHARIADPLWVDGVRPSAGSRISASEAGDGFRRDRGHDGSARSMPYRQSIGAVLPVVMLPT